MKNQGILSAEFITQNTERRVASFRLYAVAQKLIICG